MTSTTSTGRTRTALTIRLAPIGAIGTLYLVSWLPVSGPLQLAAHVLIPTIVLAELIVRRTALSRTKLVLGSFALLLACLSFALRPGDFLPMNALLAIVTFSGLSLLLMRRADPEQDYQRLVPLVAFVAMCQTFIASAQYVSSNQALSFQSMAAGDAAVGTLLTNSHLFAVNMLMTTIILAVAAAAGVHRRLAIVGTALALLGALLASALMATTLVLVGVLVAVFTALRTRIPRRLSQIPARVRFGVFFIVAVGAVLVVTLQPDNLRYTVRTLQALSAQIGESTSLGKLTSTTRSVRLAFSDAKVLVFGTGPGHYSSRAALILSGGYLLHHPSYVPVSLSTYTAEHILPLWNPDVWTRRFQDGVMNQPFYGIQTLAVEGGLLGVFVALVTYGYLWRGVIRAKADGKRAAAIKVTALLMLCVVPFLLLSDNWLEYPPVVIQLFIPVVLAHSLRRRTEDPEMRSTSL